MSDEVNVIAEAIVYAQKNRWLSLGGRAPIYEHCYILANHVERMEAEVRYFKTEYTREHDLAHAEIQGMKSIVDRAGSRTIEAERVFSVIAKKLDYMPRVYGWQEQLVTDSLALITQFLNTPQGGTR